jgi:hypothetical protein
VLEKLEKAVRFEGVASHQESRGPLGVVLDSTRLGPPPFLTRREEGDGAGHLLEDGWA